MHLIELEYHIFELGDIKISLRSKQCIELIYRNEC